MGIVGPFESDSIVTICVSRELTDDNMITSLAGAPDNSVELRMSGVLFLGGLYFPDDRSTSKTSESVGKK